jgi:hypothetical protein
MLAAFFMLVSCLTYYSILKTGAVCSTETLIGFRRPYNLTRENLHSHLCEDLRSISGITAMNNFLCWRSGLLWKALRVRDHS